MSRLWFDPSADIVKHDPPRKPLDPSRPIRKKTGGVIKVDLPEIYTGAFDQSNFSHAGLASVDASHQTGNALVVTPLESDVAIGEIVTIDGVMALDRYDKTPTGGLRQFVTLKASRAGDRVIHLYPPIYDHGEYRTVVALPMNRAAVRRYYRDQPYVAPETDPA